MAADEKLIALKKAYADIILNTAKEAAMRIMVSERKVQRFQRELQVGKDEALRMLLRLKQMMDSKITDAELKSLNQQKKIDELEAQLQEAEDIVKDLREELREVQSELEQLRNDKQHHLDEQQAVTQRGTSEENEFYYPNSLAVPPNELKLTYNTASDLRNRHQSQTTDSSKFYSPSSHMGNFYLGCPDLPSIILRSKEPELYRNGCTQRIRASEGNLSNRELSLSRKMSKGIDGITALEDIGGRESISVSSNRIRNLSQVKKKVLEVNTRHRTWQPVPSFCAKRKRATRHRKRSFSSSTSFPNQLPKTDQAPNISCATTRPTSVRSDTDFEENPLSVSTLSSEEAEPGLEASCGEASKNETEVATPAGVHNPAKEVTEQLAHTMQKSTSADILAVAVGETDPETAGISLPISEPNKSDVAKLIHGQSVNERIIKYTFQRKRKRESLSEFTGVVFRENDTSKRQTLERESDSAEQEKLNLIAESPQDSRGLSQVARQLISLSESKW